MEPLKVLVQLLLQLANLLKRAFCKHGKVPRISAQDFIPIRFKHTLHAAHLLDSLINLLRCFDHILKRSNPFLTPGSEPKTPIVSADSVHERGLVRLQ